MEAGMDYKLKNYDTWKSDYGEDDPEYEFENDAIEYDDMIAYEMPKDNLEYGYERNY